MAPPFSRFLRSDVAIDLGTASTRLHARARTVPLTRPSVIWRPDGARAALRQGVVVDPQAAREGLGDQLGLAVWRAPHPLLSVVDGARVLARGAASAAG